MSEEHLRTAIERLDTALARVEAVLARPAPGATHHAHADGAALAALEQRHAALRKVMSDSVRELEMLLAASEPGSVPDAETEFGA